MIQIAVLPHRELITAQAIYQLFQSSYKVEAELLGVKEFPPLAVTAEMIQKRASLFYGASLESQLAGAVEVIFKNEILEICSLVVDPAFFRKGIASQLMDKMLEEFDWQETVVETGQANIPAIRLYERKGYTLVDQWRRPDGIEKVKLIQRRSV